MPPKLRIPLFLVVVALSGWVFYLLYNRGHHYFDLSIYMKAMRWWTDGNELYDYAQKDFLQGKLYFTYPPFAALLLLPFSFLPIGVTQVLFILGTLAATIVTTIWIFRALDFKLEWVIFAVPAILSLEPMRETLTLGQLNILLVTLIALDLLVLARKGSKWTGIGIGLATAIKLTPGIFILYLLVTRQWRAAFTAMGAAAGATLLAAAIAPRASWDFWTMALWDTDRVGRTDITGNQSLQGMLHRLAAPDAPNRVIWLLLALAVLAFGLWRAARANSAGNAVAAMAITGLVGCLISPISWPHHYYWLAPALLALLAAALHTRSLLWLFLFCGYLVSVLGVVSVFDFGVALQPTDTVWEFLVRNTLVLLGLVLVAFLPIRHYRTTLAN